MDRERLEATAAAYHEAGHAVFCWRYGYLMSSSVGEGASVDGQGGGLVGFRSEIVPGAAEFTPKEPARRLLELRALQEAEISFAGPQAEYRYRRHQGLKLTADRLDSDTVQMLRDELALSWEPSDGPADDTTEAIRVLDEVLAADRVPGALKACRNRVSRLLRHPRTWAAVESVARELLAYDHRDADTLEELIAGVGPPRWRLHRWASRL